MTDTSYRSSFMTVLAASMALAATVPCPAAAQELGRLAVEGFAGPARVVEYFTTDCCGPTRSSRDSRLVSDCVFTRMHGCRRRWTWA